MGFCHGLQVPTTLWVWSSRPLCACISTQTRIAAEDFVFKFSLNHLELRDFCFGSEITRNLR